MNSFEKKFLCRFLKEHKYYSNYNASFYKYNVAVGRKITINSFCGAIMATQAIISAFSWNCNEWSILNRTFKQQLKNNFQQFKLNIETIQQWKK